MLPWSYNLEKCWLILVILVKQGNVLKNIG